LLTHFVVAAVVFGPAIWVGPVDLLIKGKYGTLGPGHPPQYVVVEQRKKARDVVEKREKDKYKNHKRKNIVAIGKKNKSCQRCN